MSTYLPHPGAKPKCPHCDQRGFVIRPVGERAEAQVCECVQTCPKCRDTGWVSTTDDMRGPKGRCDCQHVQRRMRLYAAANIPARHYNSRLANFEIDGPLQMMAVQAGMDFLTRFRPGEPTRGLVFHGNVGRGKTHLLCALVGELILEHGVSARFVEFSHLVADLKVAFERKSGAADVLEQLVEVDVLAIDELGKGRNTEFEGTVVDEVVSRRYNSNTPLLGTTNYTPGAASGFANANLARPQATAPMLSDRLGERVYSRIKEMCDFVPVQGEDFRQRSTRPKRRPR
ncbi:MAG: DNA replication protein DnaC [Myxococcota bacterium]|jgi:DNA replication protein DnaC